MPFLLHADDGDLNDLMEVWVRTRGLDVDEDQVRRLHGAGGANAALNFSCRFLVHK